jgi:hypothetical protein
MKIDNVKAEDMIKNPKRKSKTLPGTHSIECAECLVEGFASIDTEGRMTLPEGWRWVAARCNWGDGFTFTMEHVDCDDPANEERDREAMELEACAGE